MALASQQMKVRSEFLASHLVQPVLQGLPVGVNVAGQRFDYVHLLPSARVAKFQRYTDQQRQDYPESAWIKPEFGCFCTRQHTPSAYLRLVCRTETKEKLIDVKLSNIRSSPHHDINRKNEQWIEQNVVGWLPQFGQARIHVTTNLSGLALVRLGRCKSAAELEAWSSFGSWAGLTAGGGIDGSALECGC